MENLKMLKIPQRFSTLIEVAMPKCYEEFFLSVKLCVMKWEEYPFESLPMSFNPIDIVMLALTKSRIKTLWSGYKLFWKLKHINLSYSRDLIEMTDLSQFPKLEILNLSFCTSLTIVYSSTKLHKFLKELRLERCTMLEQLPTRISLKSLEILDVSYCSNLKRFPDISSEIPFLQYLNISQTAIEKFPFSFLRLPSLKRFHALKTSIRVLPFDIIFSKELEEFEVGCHDSDAVTWHPISFSPLGTLKSLLNEVAPTTLNGLFFYSREQSEELFETLFSRLRSLSKVVMFNCNLKAIPKSIGCWSLVEELNLSDNRFTELPDSICELSKLKYLVLNDCTSLLVLPKLPLRLEQLGLRNCLLLKAFRDIRTIQSSGEMLRTYYLPFTVTYVGFDYRTYNTLYMSPQSLFGYVYNIHNQAACCPLREPGIREGFIHRSTSGSSKKIEIDMNWISIDTFQSHKYVWALLIVYEVYGHDKRDSKKRKSDLCIGACEGSTCIFPEFLCQLQLNRTPKNTIVVCVPEIVPAGSHGVLVFVKVPLFLHGPKIHCLVSITAISENVELKECGAHLLHIDDHSELAQVVNQPDMESFRSESFLKVDGPILETEIG